MIHEGRQRQQPRCFLQPHIERRRGHADGDAETAGCRHYERDLMSHGILHLLRQPQRGVAGAGHSDDALPKAHCAGRVIGYVQRVTRLQQRVRLGPQCRDRWRRAGRNERFA